MGSEMCIRDSRLVLPPTERPAPPAPMGPYPPAGSGPALPVFSVKDIEEVIPEEEWQSPLPDAKGIRPNFAPVTIRRILDQSSSDVLRQETDRQLPTADRSAPHCDTDDDSLPPSSGGT